MAVEIGDTTLLTLSPDAGAALYDSALAALDEFLGFSDVTYAGTLTAGALPSTGQSSALLIEPNQDLFTGDGVLTPVVIMPEANDDGSDDGDLGEAVVTGWRPRDPSTGGGGSSPTSGGPGDGGGGGDAGSDGQNDCRDRNALTAAGEIKAEPDDSTKEHGSIVYKGADGAVHHSPPIQGGYLAIPLEAIEKWLTDNGISYSQVVAFVHNHPTYSYGGTDKAVSLNSYPSQNDWAFADYMVGKGAGGTSGGGFALYIINPDKELREFQYSDSSVYKGLTTSQKENELALPNQLVDDGTSCQ